MRPKPDHLGKAYAEQFADPSVVEAYRRRPPYQPAAIRLLRNLLAEGERTVLDVGCGRGDLTVPMASWASRVDALDPSAAMLEAARRVAGPECANVRWIHGGLEEAPLDGAYALATAGHSLHWTEWEVALPRLADLLRPGARLAIVARTFSESPWNEALMQVIPRYSTNQAYQPYDLVEELTGRGLFRLERSYDVPGIPYAQSVDDYIESFHSANGFSRDRMTKAAASGFDEEVRRLVEDHVLDGRVVLTVGARIQVGRPQHAGPTASP